jgi:Gpi18-like mannosyltransferase
MFFFPGSFVYSGFMSESLYLGLTIISYFYMEREQYGRGAIAASLATVARSPGILLFFIFLVHWLRKNHNLKSLLENDWRSFSKILLIPLPLMAFMGFLFYRFDSAFAFSQVHAFWGRSLASPMHNLFNNLLYFRNLSDITGAILSFTAFCSFIFIVFKIKELTVEEIIYSLAGILVPLSTSLESSIRICDVIFPLFIVISLFFNRYPRFGCQLIAALAMINALLMTFWVLGAQFYV